MKQCIEFSDIKTEKMQRMSPVMLNHVGRTTLNKAIKRLKRLKHLIKSGEGCLIDKIKGSSCRVEATNGNLFVSYVR